MEGYEIIAAGDPNTAFDRWVAALERAGIDAKQMRIADYDRESGYDPRPHPRGKEVYVLVPREQLEKALTIIKTIGR
jgi:hypothetical protein